MILETEAGDDAPVLIHFYSAKGEPQNSVTLPPVANFWGHISVSSRWIVAGGSNPHRALVRLADNKVFRFEPPVGDSEGWVVGQTLDGKTLLMLNAKTLELSRYELP